MEITSGIYTNLMTELGHLSRIDGMAAFAGIDGMGREFTVLEDELPVYIANTQKVLNSTKDSTGRIVGIPIDKEEHDWQGGAGWIVGLELDAPRKIIMFMVDWTEDGVELIGSNSTRYFSPAFDTEKKLIMGGALLNQPGSRNEKGQYLLRPVELSKSMSTTTKESHMTLETVSEVKPDLMAMLQALPGRIVDAMTPNKPGVTPPDPAITPTITQLLQSPEAIIEMGKRAEAIASERNAAYERREHVVALAADLVGGTPSRPMGLAGIHSAEIVELLMELPMAQSLKVERMIERLTNALVDFRELGSSGGGYARKPKLPVELQESAREWVAAGRSMGEFFRDIAPELKSEDYNLSDYEGVK